MSQLCEEVNLSLVVNLNSFCDFYEISYKDIFISLLLILIINKFNLKFSSVLVNEVYLLLEGLVFVFELIVLDQSLEFFTYIIG